MRSFFKQLGALAVGAVSFAATVALVLGTQQLIGFNLFSLMVWFVIPLGALITGLLAASGYYVGAVKLNARLNRTMWTTAGVSVEDLVRSVAPPPPGAQAAPG